MNVESIEFYFTSDVDKRRQSYARVVNHQAFKEGTKPMAGGIMDLHMGATESKERCSTCANDNRKCPGHTGTVELKNDIINSLAVPVARNWLKIVCVKCGALLVEKSKLEHLKPNQRLATALKVVNTKRKGKDVKICMKCGTNQPKITKSTDVAHMIIAEYPDFIKTMYPNIIREIFSKISTDTLSFMGCTEKTTPLNYTSRILVIPPTVIRPSVNMFSGKGNSFHDFTTLVQHIVKRNEQISDNLDGVFTSINKDTGRLNDTELDKTLQNQFDLCNWLVKGQSTANNGKRAFVIGGKTLSSMLRLLPSKTGYLRGNSLGKRVTFISRSTISGNCTYKIDEIGLPIAVARTLQVEEIVQPYNIEYLTGFLLNGVKKYPGCTLIVRKQSGEQFDIQRSRHVPTQLEIGDKLFRDVIDGDYAYFNRQPSLTSSSIGAHKIRVTRDPAIHTFQFNVLSCVNYNADFDGDQMSTIVPRAASSRVEADMLSGVRTHFINIGNSAPINGQTQDTVVGCYDLTRHTVRMDKIHAMQLMSTTRMTGISVEDKLLTGYDIISLSLRDTPINYKRIPNSFKEIYAQRIKYDPAEIEVEIVQGKMLRGVLDNKSIGKNMNGSIYHIISREYGRDAALNAIFVHQQIALQYMMYYGFTTSTSDLIISDESLAKIHKVVSDTMADAEVIIENLKNGEIMPPIGMNVAQYFEKLQINALQNNDARLMQYILADINTSTNGFFKMISTGSKGNDANFINICGVRGGILINEVRMPQNFAYCRTMVYFPRCDLSPESFGYATNSFMTGYSVPQFINDGRLARFSLISTALLTAVSGYFLRKGTMNHQSSIINNHRRVSKNTNIVQFMYGDDGFDPRELEKVQIRTIMMNDDELREHVGGSPDVYDQIKRDRDEYRHIFASIESVNPECSFNSSVDLPVNINRLCENVLVDIKMKGMKGVAVGTSNYAKVQELCDDFPYLLLNEERRRQKSFVSNIRRNAVWLMQVYIRSELTPRVISKFSEGQLTYIIDNIKVRYSNALIGYGTAVGLIAAQVITQPITQGMLNSKHKSSTGGSSKGGLVRIVELYQAKTIKDEATPSMIISLSDGADAKMVALDIEYLILSVFIKSVKIIIEPTTKLIYPPTASDAEWMEKYRKFHPIDHVSVDVTNWCIRIELDKTMLVLKSVSLELIVSRLKATWPGLYIMHSSELSQQIVIRMWLKSGMLKKSVDIKNVVLIMKDISKSAIRGCNRILQPIVDKRSYANVEATGAIKRIDKPVVVVSGTNLYEIALCKGVDILHTSSNSVDDTFHMLGIEAARNKIISETAIYFGNETPNQRHLQIYADEITRFGFISSIERGGVAAREKQNICLGMCYGDPIRVLQEAAINNQSSKNYDIFTPHILGSTPRHGTKYNTYMMDSAFIKENYKSINNILDSI